MMTARCSTGRKGSRLSCRALMLTTAVALANCQRSDSAAEASATPEPTEEAPPAMSVAVKALSPLSRADVLAAVAAAADDAAAGNPLPKTNLELTNRSFELRLPIACVDGATGAWGAWSIDPATKVLRVNFNRENWADVPLFAQLAAGQQFETAEGFWVERPWTRSERCPAAIAGPATPDAGGATERTGPTTKIEADHRLALVQFFSADAPRTLRRGNRPYTYTAKLPKDVEPSARSFRIKVEGRIVGYSDGQPIHCVNVQTAKPPTCAVAVEFGKVVLEDADTGESLAEWGS